MRHGAIRTLSVTNSYAQRVARGCYNSLGPREDIARAGARRAAGISASAFYEHFRMITSLTPLQFQKQLPLIEARRMLLAEGAMISNAAYAVGYESLPQFTCEYGRMFGLPPSRDVRAARHRIQSTAWGNSSLPRIAVPWYREQH
ncbi:helix-turn-helix domain-containing protein [Phyllobacterium endophyticum]|uniref:helix-turn-helix domain-containing protein n=1 Tax=Phyllobacterium endophyticum TaxID=1149773 RepID=UPI0017FFBAA3|nr:AraC family transcriptional regulator [Phyllobacterium endophyticum]MBB3237472.1 AraC-like DNA-binding protein [Phyllobacterium endophyticum]